MNVYKYKTHIYAIQKKTTSDLKTHIDWKRDDGKIYSVQKKAGVLLSRFSSVRLCVTPETAAHQAPPSLGFSRKEHWSGLPFQK